MSSSCPASAACGSEANTYARELARKIVEEDRARRESSAAAAPPAPQPAQPYVTYGWNAYDAKELARRALARGGLEKITAEDAAATRVTME